MPDLLCEFSSRIISDEQLRTFIAETDWFGFLACLLEALGWPILFTLCSISSNILDDCTWKVSGSFM